MTLRGSLGQPYRIMHGLWGMGQMMFTKYIVVVDDDVDVHNTSVPTRRDRLCANTDPQRDSIFTKGPSDVLDHATSPDASGPAAANSASTRRRQFRAKVSNAPGRRSARWIPCREAGRGLAWRERWM